MRAVFVSASTRFKVGWIYTKDAVGPERVLRRQISVTRVRKPSRVCARK